MWDERRVNCRAPLPSAEEALAAKNAAMRSLDLLEYDEVEPSIEGFERALEVFQDSMPRLWATTALKLAQTFVLRAAGDPVDANREAALQRFQSARTVFSAAEHPRDFARATVGAAAVSASRRNPTPTQRSTASGSACTRPPCEREDDR